MIIAWLVHKICTLWTKSCYHRQILSTNFSFNKLHVNNMHRYRSAWMCAWCVHEWCWVYTHGCAWVWVVLCVCVSRVCMCVWVWHVCVVHARVSLMCARVYISFVFIQVTSTNVACKPVQFHDMFIIN